MRRTSTVDRAIHRRRPVIVAVAAVALVLGTTSRADAGDRKNYPAAMCVQQGVGSTVRYTATGSVVNPSTTGSVRLVCPIVRDETGRKWNSVTVFVKDLNFSTGNVACSTRRIGSDGSTTIVETRATTGFSTAIQAMGFTIDPSTVGSFDTYVLTCTLPPDTGSGASFLLSYSVEEHDG